MTVDRLHNAYKDINRKANQLIVRNSGASAKSNNSETNVNDNNTGEVQYHTIRKGDTLGALAKKYHTSVSKLCKLNGISQNTTLRIGKKLKVR
ncbi:MAG: LysM peptidoglycan-binding domain-containing protein [Bacteroidales bacterium]|nr:LysM peptidoglycan-binding domain-containing protein [Candidatus Colimorpha merdihippi]